VCENYPDKQWDKEKAVSAEPGCRAPVRGRKTGSMSLRSGAVGRQGSFELDHALHA
jgi:hypothetical protein